MPLVSRKKSKFPTAVSAWRDIHKRGVSQKRIIRAQHTKSLWRWKVRPKR